MSGLSIGITRIRQFTGADSLVTYLSKVKSTAAIEKTCPSRIEEKRTSDDRHT